MVENPGPCFIRVAHAIRLRASGVCIPLWMKRRRHRRVNNCGYECPVEHHGTGTMTQSLAVGRENAGIRRSPEDGYTLIELLIVLTIISLVASIIGPRFLSYLGV
jgi:prepilin-type N-terminal cleavage/methylation domain-containing protein